MSHNDRIHQNTIPVMRTSRLAPFSVVNSNSNSPAVSPSPSMPTSLRNSRIGPLMAKGALQARNKLEVKA